MSLSELSDEISKEYFDDVVIKIIQPKELFKLMNVKDSDEALRVFQLALSFLVYIREGEAVETPHAQFIKTSHDTILIKSKLKAGDVVDSLGKKRIVKFLFG